MKLTDEFEDNESNNKLPLVYMTLGAVTFFVFLLIFVLAINGGGKPKKHAQQSQAAQPAEETATQPDVLTELGIGQSTLTSDQLDFWNMYREDKTQLGQQISANDLTKKDTLTKEELYEQNAQKLLDEEAQKEQEEDLSEGGTKTMVRRPDGSEQWIMINAYLPKNHYEEVGFVYDEPVMRYFADGAKQSFLGAMLRDDHGDIDFVALRKSGVEYVMVRLGYRGYESGVITLDTKYYDYMQKASDAGLNVGVYFESQAITEEEALEEAEFVIANLAEMRVTYPVVYKMGLIANTVSRIENLTKNDVSNFCNVFCERISQAGLRPMVYGNKYWLLRRMDLTLIGHYDIWLAQEGELPDYPYEFSMWQYQNAAKVGGVSSEIPLSVSFVDYAKR